MPVLWQNPDIVSSSIKTLLGPASMAQLNAWWIDDQEVMGSFPTGPAKFSGQD